MLRIMTVKIKSVKIFNACIEFIYTTQSKKIFLPDNKNNFDWLKMLKKCSFKNLFSNFFWLC